VLLPPPCDLSSSSSCLLPAPAYVDDTLTLHALRALCLVGDATEKQQAMEQKAHAAAERDAKVAGALLPSPPSSLLLPLLHVALLVRVAEDGLTPVVPVPAQPRGRPWRRRRLTSASGPPAPRKNARQLWRPTCHAPRRSALSCES
jgi:hypothetical protein